MDLVLQSSDLFNINIIVFKIDTGLAANKNQLIKSSQLQLFGPV